MNRRTWFGGVAAFCVGLFSKPRWPWCAYPKGNMWKSSQDNTCPDGMSLEPFVPSQVPNNASLVDGEWIVPDGQVPWYSTFGGGSV